MSQTTILSGALRSFSADQHSMRFKIGDRVCQKRDLRKWGYVREIVEHPWYGQCYRIYWGFNKSTGDGWCDHDLA